MRIFISGQKYFGEEVLRLCLSHGHEIVGVCHPIGDKYLGRLAAINDIPFIPSGALNADNMPRNCDLGITAHSFDYIGKKTRYIPTHGWIGYHPSLLPRHRGKSAVEWAIRMGDPITGGSVFWLNAGIDRGDVAYQDWCFIDPKLFSIEPGKAASELWRERLLPMGLRLLSKALEDISGGIIIRTAQDSKYGTWEPSTEVNDIYRPDSLMLPPKT
jgi:methionyl-tRNA formyltransferase